MNRGTTFVAAAGALAFGTQLAAAALADDIVYYEPPRMVKQGKNTTPTAGDGKVVVKVLVNADGTFKVQSIISSTNHADDAAALEIAKTSTYAPASRGPKKLLAFYDYTLIFKGGGAASTDDQAPGQLGQYERELRAGNYSGAAASLKSYAAAHPDDQRGELDLGIADTYLGNPDDAAAAFDKAGTIPTVDDGIAAKAYVEHAIALLNAKDYPNGLAAAKRGATFGSSFASQDTLGVAELESGDAASAVTDLEKAHDLAKADANLTAANKATNDVHLVQAYLASGDAAKAQTYATEAAGLDPKTGTLIAQVTGAYYAGKAQDANKAGKYSSAADLYLQAAAADPSQAAVYYTGASFAYLKSTPSEDQKAKDAADKALAASPDDPAANYAEGIALANQGKKTDAAAALSKADTLAKAAGNADLASAIERAQKQLSGGGNAQ